MIDTLAARGEKLDNILIDLFGSYVDFSDSMFRAYIKKRKDKYGDGIAFTANQLMGLAKNKYELLKEAGEWNAPSKEEEKIIALQAKFDALKHKIAENSG